MMHNRLDIDTSCDVSKALKHRVRTRREAHVTQISGSLLPNARWSDKRPIAAFAGMPGVISWGGLNI